MNPDGTINWLYILIVLGIRFIGVFVVLGILQIGINLSGKIISYLVAHFHNKLPDKT
jgi:hypothetical protein